MLTAETEAAMMIHETYQYFFYGQTRQKMFSSQIQEQEGISTFLVSISTMAAPFNTSNVRALAWSDHARSPVLVEPGHQAPESTTMLTIRSLKKNVLVWSRHDHHVLLPTDWDVIGGRGNHTRRRAGNAYFTNVVNQYTQEYVTATCARKSVILHEIRVHMHQQGRRFLRLQLYERHRRIWRWIIDPRPREKIGNKMRDTIDALDALNLDPQPFPLPPLMAPPVAPPAVPSVEDLLLLEDDFLIGLAGLIEVGPVAPDLAPQPVPLPPPVAFNVVLANDNLLAGDTNDDVALDNLALLLEN